MRVNRRGTKERVNQDQFVNAGKPIAEDTPDEDMIAPNDNALEPVVREHKYVEEEDLNL
jgi:hypothetical protein